MVAPLIGIAVLVIGAIFILPRVGLPLNVNEAQRKAIEQEKANERDNKGAFANTWDFFWGNGASARDFGSKTKGGGNAEKTAMPHRHDAPRANRHYRRRGKIA